MSGLKKFKFKENIFTQVIVINYYLINYMSIYTACSSPVSLADALQTFLSLICSVLEYTA